SFFNARVPEFSGFSRLGHSLWHYTDALAEIEAQWTTPAVVQLLEFLMFRSEGSDGTQPFDLAAYDDLLLLLAVAQTTPASARGAAPPRQRTTPTTQAAADEVLLDLPVTQAPLARVPGAAMDPGLDFDMASFPQSWESIELASGFGVSANGRLDFDLPLDLDLSESPSPSPNDFPKIPASAPLTADQPIGFGTKSDLFEVRFEEELTKKHDK
ncbi:MAG: hypothetical protein K2Q97_19380, partial [Burkholderiaceae bacterium]|nr:hypothetical protein [Burkholderiaceae bacterium]